MCAYLYSILLQIFILWEKESSVKQTKIKSCPIFSNQTTSTVLN